MRVAGEEVRPGLVEGSHPVSNPASQARERYTVSFLSTYEEWHAPDVSQLWRALLRDNDNPSALFQSPEWFDNKHITKPQENICLAVLRDAAAVPIGLAPLIVIRHELRVGRGLFNLLTMNLRLVQVLGDQPMLPADPALYDHLFTAILDAFPEIDGIYMRLLPTESQCRRFLSESPVISDRFLVHVQPHGPLYFIDLPQTFAAYLARSKSKSRRHLTHPLKVCREHAGADFHLERVTAAQDVPKFLRVGGTVAAQSWQAAYADYLIRDTPAWTEHLSDLADRGLLRSYLLMCGSKPCTYLLGFQGYNDFHASMIGYEQAPAKCCPGRSTFLLVIEDLIQNDPPKRLNFGLGDDVYKQRLANASTEVASVFLFRKTALNRLRQLVLIVIRNVRTFFR